MRENAPQHRLARTRRTKDMHKARARRGTAAQEQCSASAMRGIKRRRERAQARDVPQIAVRVVRLEVGVRHRVGSDVHSALDACSTVDTLVHYDGVGPRVVARIDDAQQRLFLQRVAERHAPVTRFTGRSVPRHVGTSPPSC